MNKFYARAQELEEDIIANRRALHSYGEIGFELPRTLERISGELRRYGIEPKQVGRAGLTATIGSGEGPVILLRADMDGLPMPEQSGLDFAAQNGNCQSCGHDCHAAMLLGAARLLKEREAELPGRVKLMFQPAEELLAGAQDMIDHGILENPKPDAAVGMHISVGTPDSGLGQVRYARRTATFSGDAVTVTVHGKDAHGSAPQAGVDAIAIAAHITLALQQLIAREISCGDNAVLIVGKISGGTSCNTLAGQAVLECSVRAATRETREFLKRRLKEVAEGTAQTLRGRAEVEYVYGMPPLVNDPQLSDEIAAACAEVVPAEQVVAVEPSFGAEDFSALSEHLPTAFLTVGAGSPEEGYTHGMHHPAMRVDERVLPLGAALYAQAALRYLENRKK
jgi:amidohydrolase